MSNGNGSDEPGTNRIKMSRSSTCHAYARGNNHLHKKVIVNVQKRQKLNEKKPLDTPRHRKIKMQSREWNRNLPFQQRKT